MVATPGSDSIARNGSPSVPGVCVSSSAASLTSVCVGFARTTVSKDCPVPAGASRSASGSVVGARVDGPRQRLEAGRLDPQAAQPARNVDGEAALRVGGADLGDVHGDRGARDRFPRPLRDDAPGEPPDRRRGRTRDGHGVRGAAVGSAAVPAVATVAAVARVAAVAPHARVRGPRVHRERHRQQGDGDDHGTVATQMPS